MNTRIPMARPDLTRAEHLNVNEAMRSGWISQGPFVEKAENILQGMTGRRYAICTASGTAALMAALMAVTSDVGEFEAVVPSLTFGAVHNVVDLAGGTPLFMGADEQTWQVPDAWNARTSDVVISAPCYGGQSGHPNYWRAFTFIEDASESFGGSLRGRKAGTFGDISCISFYANKIVTAGEGGALLTDDDHLYKQLKLIINHGIGNKEYRVERLGFNGRMTDLQAAVLCAQLDRMSEMVEKRRVIMAEYRRAAAGRWYLPDIKVGEVPAPWVFAGMPADMSLSDTDNRTEVIRQCEADNIEWRPLFAMPDDANYNYAPMLAAKKISAKGICLPLWSQMGQEEVDRVCGVIRG